MKALCGGYAGLTAASLAARWTGAQVTLVNDLDRFTERVQLHQWPSGSRLLIGRSPPCSTVSERISWWTG